MRTTIKASGEVVLTEELRSYVAERVVRLEKLIDSADTTAFAAIELATTTSGQKTGNIYRAEFNVQFSGGFVRAEAVRDTMHAAIDEAIEEAKRELRKARGRRRDLMRRGAARVKDFFRQFGK